MAQRRMRSPALSPSPRRGVSGLSFKVGDLSDGQGPPSPAGSPTSTGKHFLRRASSTAKLGVNSDGALTSDLSVEARLSRALRSAGSQRSLTSTASHRSLTDNWPGTPRKKPKPTLRDLVFAEVRCLPPVQHRVASLLTDTHQRCRFAAYVEQWCSSRTYLCGGGGDKQRRLGLPRRWKPRLHALGPPSASATRLMMGTLPHACFNAGGSDTSHLHD